MSEVEFVKNLLETNWEEAITGRAADVPQPFFSLEKGDREASLRSQDVGYVASGADTQHTPMGFSWTHQEIETAVVIQYRVANRNNDTGHPDPYNRLFGKRTGASGLGEPDRWDGIVGETQRVILAERRGHAEWDRVGNGITVSDLTDMGGTNYHRADVLIPMDIIADKIDTSI